MSNFVRFVALLMILLVCASIAYGQFRPYRPTPKDKDKSQNKTQSQDKAQTENKGADESEKPQQVTPTPEDRIGAYQFPTADHCEILTVQYDGDRVTEWSQVLVDEQTCLVSPVLKVGREHELNHHRVTVTFTGTGSVEMSLGHYGGDKLDDVITKENLRSKFETLKSGQEIPISSSYKQERCAWLFLRIAGQVKITDVRHTFWRGQDTIYGHVPGQFEFAGLKLPYRLMYPRNYDPNKTYPLTLSVSGSGGIGADNIKNMEQVILARYLFTNYYYDNDFECFSLVPQIPDRKTIPSPYWPSGDRGKPSSYHPALNSPPSQPALPMLDENGWYVQATLALIHKMIENKNFHIDPDRIYYSGFSFGGKGCWEFLKADRTLFAAAMCGAGWPIGQPYTDPTGPLLERLKLEVQRYKHTPVYIFAGQLDGMRYGSSAVDKEIRAQGGNSTYIEFPNTDHVSTAGKAWGKRDHIVWLFQQNRKNNPPPGEDPFPNGVYP